MPRKEGCTKCCWCGLDLGDIEKITSPYHACTGEEKEAIQCADRKNCWSLKLWVI